MKSLASEGLMLAAFTAASYVVAYQYESGFSSYWQIPSYLIDISITSVVASALGLFTLFVFTALIVNLPVTMLGEELERKMDLRKKIVIINLSFFIVMVAIFIGYGFTLVPISLFVFILVLQIIVIGIPWAFDKKKNPNPAGFFERLAREYSVKKEPNSGYYYLEQMIGKRQYYLVVAVIPALILLSSSAGRLSARMQNTYAIVEEDSLVILKKYNDIFILRPINIKEKSVSRRLLLWTQNDFSEKSVVTKFTGRVELGE